MSSDTWSLKARLLRTLRRARHAPGEIRDAGGLRYYIFYLPGPGPWLMSWLRKQWVLFRNPRANIAFLGPVYLGPRFSLHMPAGGTFIVGPGVEFRRGFRAELTGPESRITIGAGTAFTYDVVIQCASTIDIGARCLFAQAAMLVDGSHRFKDLDRPVLHQGYDLRPLTIGDDVSVMSKSTVIASVAERTFVGANSVVTRNLPPFCVAAGVPARVIDYFGPPGQEPPEFEARSASSASTSG
jgi:acetyltransferase-like isoleucine patch superfamily enzyme